MLYELAIMAGASPRVPAYNAACCYALLGKSDEAFAWLGQSIDAGWRDVEHLRADTDFQSLHADPRCESVSFVRSQRSPWPADVFSEIRASSLVLANIDEEPTYC